MTKVREQESNSALDARPPDSTRGNKQGSHGDDGAGTPSGTNQVRVLVVDDDELVRSVVSEMLRTAGHQVEAVAGPHEALELFASDRFDLVLTDESMPDMLGSELAAEIKSRRPHTMVVLLTGWGSGPSDASIPGVVDMILSKPVKESELLACVSKRM
ncbi:MAG: response regulator [Armatimonadota bacterium]